MRFFQSQTLLTIAVIIALFALGCSETGTVDSNEQSSDDIFLLDSDSNTDTLGNKDGGWSDSASGQQNGNSNGTDDTYQNGHNGQNDGDTEIPMDTELPGDTATGSAPAQGTDSENMVDSALGDTAVADTGSSNGNGHGQHDAADTSEPDSAVVIDADDTTNDTIEDTEGTEDTVADTAEDTEVIEDTAQDTQGDDTETDIAACPHSCRSENWCARNDGVVYETLECEEANRVCCELEGDTDSQDSGHGGDTDSVTEFTCIYECESNSWCNTNSAVVYEELTCRGNRVCCAIEE